MLSRLFDRSVRWLIASLAIAALVTALAVPVQAAPRSESGESTLAVSLVERLAGWVEAWFGVPHSTRSSAARDQAESVSSMNGSCIDPDGNPVACPEKD